MIKTAILTASDACSKGEREDLSTQTAVDSLDSELFEVCETVVVPDDRDAIIAKLTAFADEKAYDLVLTTGGTGLGPRDITPEATIEVCERLVPGLAELMRAEGLKHTPNAMLSRSIVGIRGSTLIVNLPGSPKAVKESLEAIHGTLPHAIKMLKGHGH